MSIVNSILTVFSWGIVCILLFFLYRIAQFYEKKSGRHSYFWAFLIPAGLFGVAAIRYAYLAPAIAGDPWGDIMRFLGGVTLGGFGFYLLKLMVGGRPQ